MLHTENEKVRGLLLKGNFGLEKESLRILPDGTFAHTPHPFPDDEHIVRDFCENQTEINTPVSTSAEGAVKDLLLYTAKIEQKLAQLPQRELLWPFSNPPFIRNEDDIPVARFTGGKSSKTDYREYLSDRYGRYKMTLCGIHFNYSFSDELLRADFEAGGGDQFRAYKDRLYLSVAEKAAAFGWIVTALTAASPLADASFFEKGVRGGTSFSGMASIRCSELGYWNYFTPVFDYSDIVAYADSIQRYVDKGLLTAPTELYYPIRLKPRGRNDLQKLKNNGVDHIEFRMVDLNPLQVSGVCLRDLQFIQLFLIWLAAAPEQNLDEDGQILAAQNFKNAAHYDLKTVRIIGPGKKVLPAADAGIVLIRMMKEFYQNLAEADVERGAAEGGPSFHHSAEERFLQKDSAEEASSEAAAGDRSAMNAQEIQEVLAFEEAKLVDPDRRYAWTIRRDYADGFLEKGLELAERRQQELIRYVSE